ncbi:glycine--tRNA ligase subunit beta [Shimia haliotis]|uniref:Glycine--tRNA ligase beta subunit n=1 Tax=Shimia haliotis TaxID=1280847 RepID=A0A1I4CPU3_9RHOB|nr:glycine--tRNA ligase subunit beta [Shimia haliotis]SFK82076.1 glycyl-tRNA synthetase beta chain [Shimia haliotis]
MPNLLIELFSEEIPARMQARAADDLKKKVTDGLVEAGLTYGGAKAFSTPRRLTLALEDLLSESPTVKEERKGPKVGAPEKALEGFLRGAGVAREDLEERDTPKGAVYFATITKPGRPAAEIVAEVLEDAIRNFPWPKSMRWGAGSLRWVRPLHSILCVLSSDEGHEVVAMDVDGITAGDTTEGHRFMGSGRFAVHGFEDYEAKLKRDRVILNAEERAEAIWSEATNMAFAQRMEVVEDKGLLAEVAGLVEWPVVLMGDIAEDFLGLPPEVLQTSMKEHQKFFSVKNPKTGRIEKFITVANRETADQGATILAGNQKVLFARLSDAKFFWENDIRVASTGAAEWLESLDNVTFHNKLGSQGDRIGRIAALAAELAPVAGAEAVVADTAARWAKADLSSEMVYEFPELQGLMGRYYAETAGHPAEVAAAAEEHYSPLGPSDDVPGAPVSVSVALADKLDTLTGFWAIDEKPTGSKDPFALRRAALGVIRLVLENGLRMPLDAHFERQLLRHEAHQSEDDMLTDALAKDIEVEIADHGVLGAVFHTIKAAVDGELPKHLDKLRESLPDVSGDLLGFFHDRLKVYLRDQGIRHDVIDACIAMPGNDDLALLVARAQALQDFMSTEDGENLLQGFKRANNILSQAEEKDGVEYSYGADVKFAEDETEKALFAALDGADGAITAALGSEDFALAMGTMASLRAPIDAFFEAVQVNSDNEVVRRNRLNLLSRIRGICLQAADLTRVEG